MDRLREIAKFACGWEAFHAAMHAYFWVSGTQLTAFGITLTAQLNIFGAILGTAISVTLGIYAWRPRRH